MHTIQIDERRHSETVLSILNEAITTSTALYDYTPRTLEMMTSWFEAKRKGGYPVIGVLGTADLDRLAQQRPGDQLRLLPAQSR